LHVAGLILGGVIKYVKRRTYGKGEAILFLNYSGVQASNEFEAEREYKNLGFFCKQGEQNSHSFRCTSKFSFF